MKILYRFIISTLVRNKDRVEGEIVSHMFITNVLVNFWDLLEKSNKQNV